MTANSQLIYPLPACCFYSKVLLCPLFINVYASIICYRLTALCILIFHFNKSHNKFVQMRCLLFKWQADWCSCWHSILRSLTIYYRKLTNVETISRNGNKNHWEFLLMFFFFPFFSNKCYSTFKMWKPSWYE